MEAFHKEEKRNDSVSRKFVTLSEEGLKVLERELETATVTHLTNKRLSL